jgi:hypothetical protein
MKYVIYLEEEREFVCNDPDIITSRNLWAASAFDSKESCEIYMKKFFPCTGYDILIRLTD